MTLPIQFAMDAAFVLGFAAISWALCAWMVERHVDAKANQAKLIPRVLSVTFLVLLLSTLFVPLAWGMSGILDLIGASPVVHAFMACLCTLTIARAQWRRGRGLESCNQTMVILTSSYFLCWNVVCLLGAANAREVLSLQARSEVLKATLTALPITAFVFFASRREDRVWQSLLTQSFLALLAAVVFCSLERGFAESWFPASDWLRFPLIGLLFVSLCTFPFFALLVMSGGLKRPSALRDMRVGVLIFAVIGVAMGLAWAGSRFLLALT